MPVLAVAVSCMSIAASLVPFAVSSLPDKDYLNWISSSAILISASSASSAPLMLLSAYCTVVVFTDLHHGIKWAEKSLSTPTAWHRWWARPDYLVELPLEEEEDGSDEMGDAVDMQDNSEAARSHHAR
jgi:hypothetical protein